MANETFTSRLGLRKPAQTDYYDVDVFNGNADTIDAKTVKRPDSGTSGNIAVFNGDRDVVDGGKPVSALVPKVPSARVGNLPVFTNGGGIADSGHALGEYATAAALALVRNYLTKYTFAQSYLARVVGRPDGRYNTVYFPDNMRRDNTDYGVAITFEDRGRVLNNGIFGTSGEIDSNWSITIVEKRVDGFDFRINTCGKGTAHNYVISDGETPFYVHFVVTGGLSFS